MSTKLKNGYFKKGIIMFEKSVYIERRNKLREAIESGLILFLGNHQALINFASNNYHFRQDSNILYFFGLNQPDLAAIIDVDEGKDIVFGDDPGLDEVIWTGFQKPLAKQAQKIGIETCCPYSKLEKIIHSAILKGRKVHFLPWLRADTKLEMHRLFGIDGLKSDHDRSLEFIKEIVRLRSIKEDCEMVEIMKAIGISEKMNMVAMRNAIPGMFERDIYAAMVACAYASGSTVSFPGIVTQKSQILHCLTHNELLVEGRMLLSDTGAETSMGYASDITRIIPIDGKFNSSQKEIYQIVLDANDQVIQKAAPGISFKSLHLLASKIIVKGLIGIGVMKGDCNEAVKTGAHALFFPHGLGHQMGLDAHDMESLGEDYVGYDESIRRSDQFGLNHLRFAKKLKPGHVLTVEPGCYFIPDLIEQWRSDNKFSEFINYNKVDAFKDFGGIRIEDDIFITEDGCINLSNNIPKTIQEIESRMA